MAALTYPKEIPTDDIKAIIAMVTGKTPANLSEALLSAWIVQGYLQGLLVPPKASAKAVSACFIEKKQPKLTDAQAVAALGTLIGQRGAKGSMEAQGLLGGLIGGTIKTQIAKLLLPVLVNWVQKWLADGGLQKIIDKVTGDL